ncbi:XRE family transcriptional regulator [[Clostridium] innocuum]|nr:XRE family transcriptional regulator [[Clostridium] innocuum]
MKKIDMNFYKELGLLLRKARNNVGISLDELSLRLDNEKSKSTLMRYENGESRIDQSILEKICSILNVESKVIIDQAKVMDDFGPEFRAFEQENEKLNENFDQSYNFRSLVNSIGWSIELHGNDEDIDEYKLIKNSIVVHLSADEYFELMNTSKNFLEKILQDLVKKKLDPTYKPEPYKEFIMIQPPILVPYYGHVASAGTGQYVFDDIPPEMIEIENEMDNMQVDFAIGVNGDSMDPTYHDGDTLLIKKQSDINTGEIGIFMINGEAFVKELGDGVLISHNKKYKDIRINDSVICLGKVISKHIS